MKPTEVPMPPRLAQRPVDRRGYPIPWIVVRDAQGVPHFTINDAGQVARALIEKRCGLCGHKLNDNIWLIGGPAAAFHAQGGYIDPPVHKDCGTYALQVCPFLAVSYGKRIDDKTLTDKSGSMILIENGMPTGQPTVFVFARTSKITVQEVGMGGIILVPNRPWREVQFWRHGERITPQKAAVYVGEDTRLPCAVSDLTDMWQDE